MRHASVRLTLILGLVLAACDDGPVTPEPEPLVGPALREAGATITSADITERVGALADDSTMGRDTPSSGLESAARYLAAELAATGLEPAGTEGYLQRYDFEYTLFDSTNVRLELEGGGGPDLRFGRDFVMVGSAAGDTTGSMLWGGSAETSPDAGGLDMRGRVVLWDLPVSRLDSGAVFLTFGPDGAAQQGGAAAYGFVVSPAFTEEEMKRAADQTVRWSRAHPLFFLREPAAEALLSAAGADLGVLRSGGPQAVDPGRIRVRGLLGTVIARPPNVVGILRGSNPVLRDEYVALSAHFDHVGTDRPNAEGDSIFNGADDDASGTAAVLEVAEALSSLETPPARSVLFLLASGEEYGLVGSMAFMAAPTVPVSSIVADVNLDMIGRNAPDSIFGVGARYTEMGVTAVSVAGQERGLGLRVIEDATVDDHTFLAGDQVSFACEAIPAILLHSGLHEDYHGRNDELERLDTDKAARVARLAFYLVDLVADAHDPPTWTSLGATALSRLRRCR